MTPLAYTWMGDSFTPLARFAKECDRVFVVGQVYRLEIIEERSAQSHRHYFAAIHDAWLNLNEDIADEFPSSEHLRAWGLMKAGFADKRIVKCASSDDAIECAAAVKSGERTLIIDITGRIVTIWTPHSQSMRAMGKAKFTESKRKVLDAIAARLGVSTDTLTKQAGRAA